MNAAQTNSRRWWTLSPLFGSLVFIFLYTMAAAFYPGGSQADAHAKGFSWMHNYWCNLLSGKALNGEINAGRPFAYTAMVVAALMLLGFLTVAAMGFDFSKRSKIIVLACGLLSLLPLPFLNSSYHDAVANASPFFGLVAMLFVYAGLYKSGWKSLFLFGLFNLVLVAWNNYLWHFTTLYWLPLVQKITFASFLLWICLVTVRLYRHPKGQA
ncbi:hypothetical protein [Flavisolibacter ginsenosidimutans]|uniref:DUF998 domain-containing protein n=1 Tax=Flavisolibacter ginsenosidimutans TaxID=661481 RepID=A0A5B8UEJ1_9BACT|nr:hypothetical protein [Flavisolibacter ginsenosidimutans]QEC54726.1 hypothetical protein FSB75_02025 [Flavisolibacter ginsenosidimutans]